MSTSALQLVPSSPEMQQDFGSFLKDRVARYVKEDQDVNQAENLRSAINQHFYRGNQYGRVSAHNFNHRKVPSFIGRMPDPQIPYNIVRPMVRSVVAQHTMARTELIVLPVPTDSPKTHVAGAARYASDLAKRLQWLVMTETWRQTRSKYAINTGLGAFYSYWDPKGGIDFGGYQYKPTATRPIYELQEAAFSQGAYVCQQCGQGGPFEEANETGHCPACMSDQLEVEQPVTGQVPVVTGHDKVPLGFLCCRQVPRWQLKWDRMASMLSESAYLLWEFPARLEQIQDVYPWFDKSKGTGQSQEQTSGLKTEYELRQTAGNVIGRAGRIQTGQFTDRYTVQNWWLPPFNYRKYEFKTKFEYGDKQVIEPGQKAIELWPEGLFATLINGEVAGLAAEDLTEHWLIAPYDLIPGQIGGDGMEDIIPLQREINKTQALRRANVENVAGAGALFNPDLIDRENVPSHPFDAKPIKKGMSRQGLNLRTEVVAHVERPALGSDVSLYQSQLLQLAQFQLGASPGVTGSTFPLPQGTSDTATEAMLQAQGARAQRSPELAIIGQYDAALMFQWLRLVQKNLGPYGLWLPQIEGENELLEERYFFAADIPNNFIVTTKTRGSMPKSEEDRQADFKSAVEAAGGWQGVLMLATQMPKALAEIERRYDVSFDITDIASVTRLVRYRIDTMMSNLEAAKMQAVMMGDPNMVGELLINDPRVTPLQREPHQLFLMKYGDLLLSDEILKARTEQPEKLLAIDAMMTRHEQLMQGPMVEAAMQQQEAAQEQEAQQGDAMAQMRADEDQREAAKEQRTAARAEQQAESKHQRDVELLRMRSQMDNLRQEVGGAR